ncbi:MAG: ABC transporter permease [Thermoanaerobaculia bacterium]|nr:ABC transporter permease [Thermoanaerobaculia bacterium]
MEPDGFRLGALHPQLAFRLALRQMQRAPGSMLYAALTLAIGFGAAIAIYSVQRGFQAPIPVPDGEQVHQVRLEDPEHGRSAISTADLEAWRRDGQTLETLGAFTTFRSAVMTSGRATRLAQGVAITREGLELLRVQPQIGRLPADQTSVLISHRLWRDWLGGRDDVLGITLRVADVQHTVAGVMPPGFRFPFHHDLWQVRRADDPEWSGLEVFGRLKDGTTRVRAGEELTAILTARRLGASGGESTAVAYVHGFTEKRGEGGEVTMLFGLLLMVLALVLVSCSNVSNLFLERSAARARSLSVHQAVGAAPGQIVLQIFTEALLVATLGVVLGACVAAGIVAFVEGTLADHWGYFWMRVELDPSALFLAAGLAIATALVSGTLPALQALRRDLAEPLKQETKSGRHTRRTWVSWTLMTGQVAFSCIGVIASVLMGLGLLESRRVSEGFPVDEVLWTSVSFEGTRFESAEPRRSYRQALLSRLAEDPSVRRASLSSALPGLYSPFRKVTRAGRPLEEHVRPVAVAAASPGFFDVYQLEMLEGRGFLAAESSEAVAVVSRDFVQNRLDGEPAVGSMIDLHGGGEARSARIVGVVSNLVIYDRDHGRRRDAVYVPLGFYDPDQVYLSVRFGDQRAPAGAALEKAAYGAAADVPIGEIQSMREILAYVRQFMETLGTLALLGGLGAVVVVTIGLYGLVSFDVRRRLPEFALRLALGAGTRRVLLGVLRKGLLLVLPGILLGLGAMYLIAPLLGIFLGGSEAHDPRVFGGAVAVYGLIVLVAAGIPARRAAFCSPVEILREE